MLDDCPVGTEAVIDNDYPRVLVGDAIAWAMLSLRALQYDRCRRVIQTRCGETWSDCDGKAIAMELLKTRRKIPSALVSGLQ